MNSKEKNEILKNQSPRLSLDATFEKEVIRKKKQALTANIRKPSQQIYPKSPKSSKKNLMEDKEHQKSLREKSETTDIVPNLKPINLLNHIRLIIKAARKLRFRSSCRDFKGLKENQLEFINDEVFFPEKNQRNYSLKRYSEANVLFFSFFLSLE